MHVHRAGNRRHLLFQLPGDLVIAFEVAPDHLDVDRRRQAEVQDLVGDIGGLEVEAAIREFLVEALPQLLVVALCRVV